MTMLSLRDRLAANLEERLEQESVLDPGLMKLPNPYRKVMVWLQRSELFDSVRIAHQVDEIGCPIDFAWLERRVGLRLATWPRSGSQQFIPEFAYTDALLRERGWLIFPVDTASATFPDQLNRAMSVIKKVPRYRR